MIDVDETRVIYSDNGSMIVTVQAETDDEITAPDGDCYTDEDVAAFHRGEWGYVVLTVAVRFNGTRIGRATLGLVDHGTLADGTEVDAFAWAPAVVNGNTTTMGSSLWGVAEEAVSDAWWLSQRLTGGALATVNSPISRMLRTFLPVNREDIDKAHDEALAEVEA